MTHELITAILSHSDESKFMLEDLLKEKFATALEHRKIELAATMMEDMDANGVIQLSPEQKRAKKAKDDHASAVDDQNDKDSDDQDDSDSSQSDDSDQNKKQFGGSQDDSDDDQDDSDSDQDDDSDDDQTKKPAFLKKDVKEAFRPDHKNGRALGEFQEKDHGKWFTYRHTNDPWAKKHGLTHEIDVGPHGDVRFGNVKSTRVHIATDENDDGTPKLDTWHLKKHNRWQQNESVELSLDESENINEDWVTTHDRKISKALANHKANPTPETKRAVSDAYAAKRAAEKKHRANIKGKDYSHLSQYESVTNYNPKSQGGTRKELLALYAKTKDPKHAEAARKAGAANSELQAARLAEMAMDAIKHPTHGKIEWRNEGGAHMITTKGANGSTKIHAMGSHKEISAKWAKLKSKLMTEDINWISDK